MKFIIEDKSIKSHFGFGPLIISPNEELGYKPYELFVSSMVGCSGTLLRNILTKKRIPFQSIEMTVSSIRNKEFANRIEKLSIKARIQSEVLITTDQAEKIESLVIKNCGMIQSVIKSIDITFKIVAEHEEEINQ